MNAPRESSLAEKLAQGLSAYEIDDSLLPYFDELGDEGREAMLELATDARHEPRDHRCRAAFVLGALGWRPAFDALVKLTGDDYPRLRLQAIHACAEVGGPAAIEPLLRIAEDIDRPVVERVHALRPIASIGDHETLDRLAQWDCEKLPVELVQQLRETEAALGNALWEDQPC